MRSVEDERRRYDNTQLSGFVRDVLVNYGLPEADAQIGASVLIEADLRGIETHGIANFVTHWHYAKGLQLKAVNPNPTIGVLRDSPVAASWDSDRGFGPVVAHKAMNAAIAKARTTGMGTVAVRNGCHSGAIGYYARMAAEADMIGLVMSHSMATSFAPDGLDPVSGTNPIAFAAPVPDSHPVSWDMATTAVAGTNLLTAQRLGIPIPRGWAIDARGEPTTSAHVREEGGSLLYLGAGADGGGYKGYGLALMVDIMSGILSGTGSGLWQSYSPQWRQGQWFAAWRIDAFVDPGEFAREIKRLVDHIHASRPAQGHERVTVPGDRGATTRDRRLRDGIPIDDDIVAICEQWARETGVVFPAHMRVPAP